MKGKLLFIAAFVGAIWYFFLRKKTPPVDPNNEMSIPDSILAKIKNFTITYQELIPLGKNTSTKIASEMWLYFVAHQSDGMIPNALQFGEQANSVLSYYYPGWNSFPPGYPPIDGYGPKQQLIAKILGGKRPGIWANIPGVEA